MPGVCVVNWRHGRVVVGFGRSSTVCVGFCYNPMGWVVVMGVWGSLLIRADPGMAGLADRGRALLAGAAIAAPFEPLAQVLGADLSRIETDVR